MQEEHIQETAKQRSRRLANEKANDQLRENRRTASHKLERDIFFSLLVETGRDTCCRCGKCLTKETFSIDHMKNWLDSEDPRETFYDIANIDFACKSCNSLHNRGRFGLNRADPMPTLAPRKPLIYRRNEVQVPPKELDGLTLIGKLVKFIRDIV